MIRRLVLLATLAPSLAFAANELPSIGAPNGTVRSQPSAIVVPENPASPGGAGCVVGSTGCVLVVDANIEGGIVTADQGDPGGAPWLTADQSRALPYAEQTATVAISATWNGTTRDAGTADGSAGPWGYFWSQITSASAAGTQYIQCATDSAMTTPRVVATQAIGASSSGNPPLKSPRGYRYCRSVFINGGTSSNIVVSDGFLGN